VNISACKAWLPAWPASSDPARGTHHVPSQFPPAPLFASRIAIYFGANIWLFPCLRHSTPDVAEATRSRLPAGSAVNHRFFIGSVVPALSRSLKAARCEDVAASSDRHVYTTALLQNTLDLPAQREAHAKVGRSLLTAAAVAATAVVMLLYLSLRHCRHSDDRCFSSFAGVGVMLYKGRNPRARGDPIPDLL